MIVVDCGLWPKQCRIYHWHVLHRSWAQQLAQKLQKLVSTQLNMVKLFAKPTERLWPTLVQTYNAGNHHLLITFCWLHTHRWLQNAASHFQHGQQHITPPLHPCTHQKAPGYRQVKKVVYIYIQIYINLIKAAWSFDLTFSLYTRLPSSHCQECMSFGEPATQPCCKIQPGPHWVSRKTPYPFLCPAGLCVTCCLTPVRYLMPWPLKPMKLQLLWIGGHKVKTCWTSYGDTSWG